MQDWWHYSRTLWDMNLAPLRVALSGIFVSLAISAEATSNRHLLVKFWEEFFQFQQIYWVSKKFLLQEKSTPTALVPTSPSSSSTRWTRIVRTGCSCWSWSRKWPTWYKAYWFLNLVTVLKRNFQVKDGKKTHHKFPHMSSYHRMLVHRYSIGVDAETFTSMK